MKVRDILGTIGAWSTFAAALLAFDPALRFARLFGVKTMDQVLVNLAHVLKYTVGAGFCSLRVEGREHILNRSGAIIVGNHQSLVESFLPFYELRTMKPKYISKRILGYCFIPSVSFVLRNGGHCLIDRENREQALQAIEKLGAEVNKSNCSAIIFPEGTRSLQGGLQHFKKGGLKTLLQCAPNAPIFLMIIHNGNKIYPKGLPRVAAGSVVTMRFLPVLDRHKFSNEDELIEHIHDLMADNYTALEAEDQARDKL
ncbi:MAG: lysophospholipid acyltransferase family protein [Candidatus Bruticola sp.]